MNEDSRGLGRIFQRTFKNRKTGRKKATSTWWIEFHHKGKQVRKPTGSTKRSDAMKMLREHLDASTGGKLVTGRGERFRFDDLADLLRRDYRLNQRRSLQRAEAAIAHLKSYFGNYRALDIADHDVDAYVDLRLQEDKVANATVNYEISMLKRMYRLARKILSGYRPAFPHIRISNTRTGFFEEPDFRSLLSHLEEDLRPPVEFAYLTGWRIRSEVFRLQWPQVDFTAGEIRLEPGTTKTDEGRTFLFGVLPELENLLKAQRARTDLLQKEQGRIIPWVFHRDGNCVKDFRVAWRKAVKASGTAGRIPHDFRRTAVRNLERSGVPRSVAMKLVGHKTESIYRRYAIVARQDLVDGIKRLADYRAGIDKSPAEQKVVEIGEAAK
jgi:integrase